MLNKPLNQSSADASRPSLHLYALEPIDTIAQPNIDQSIDLDSSALNVFTDFKRSRPLTLPQSSSAINAHQEMQRTHVNLKLVVNEHQQLVGLVDRDSVSDERLMQFLPAGRHRQDITLAEVMTPMSALQALDYQELKDATVGTLLQTLMHEGLQHCLVVDREQHAIRGMISARDLARRLHLAMDLQKRLCFADVCRVVGAS